MRDNSRASTPVNSRAHHLLHQTEATQTAHENRYLESRALFARAPAPLAKAVYLSARDYEVGRKACQGSPEISLSFRVKRGMLAPGETPDSR